MECRIPTELPPLWADRDLLARVLQNLLDNAIKFTPSRGEIVVRVDQPDAESLLFVISDTGLGIPPDQQEHIFDRFARVRREEGEGAGLGLALCKLAVEAHGGRIWVESEPDQGSTFKFILPLGEEEATS
jgi:signal transduction histidine kinase